MKNKKIGFLSVILGIAVVGIVIYFISRPPPPQELLPQTFSQLPEKPKLIDEFHQNTEIYSVAFSPSDPSLIAFADQYGTIKLWFRNITNKAAPILSHPGLSASVGFSPTGKLLASAGFGKLVLWDVASRSKLNTLDTSHHQFAFTPDEQKLVTVQELVIIQDGTKGIHEAGVKIWDIRNPKKITEIATIKEPPATKGSTRAVGISSDGKWIAAGYSSGTINVLDLQTQRLVKTLETPFYEINYVRFSPNNKYMVVGGRDLERSINSSVKGYIMWELPSWQRKGEVLRGNVENLVFSPDGKICMAANNSALYGRGVELWSTANGAPISLLPTEARDASFSQDGNLIVTGGKDGIVRVWELTQSQLDFVNNKNDVVRLIYYLPKDKEPSPNITQKIDKTIRKVQKHYADEMERHGFGRKTFSFEADQNGKAKIYLIKENQSNNYDLSNGVWLTIKELKFRETFPYSSYVDHSDTFQHSSNDVYSARNNLWKGYIEGIIPWKNVHATVKSLNCESIAYTLKGAFGVSYTHSGYKKQNSLKRLFTRGSDRMPWGKWWAKLSKCEAEWLDKSRFFNPNQSFFDKPPKMDMHVSTPKTNGLRHFIFEIADEDGIHQVQMFASAIPKFQNIANKFEGCRVLKGKKAASVVFEISDTKIETVLLQMMDMHGNIASREFTIRENKSEQEKEP